MAVQGSLIDKFFLGMWISTVEMMKERASCVQQLISTVTGRAKKVREVDEHRSVAT